MRTRFVIVTGGVCSSLGKGILASSLARLLLDRGIATRNIKLDPYLNVDPGTMRPAEHGECFVTEDGAECDLDLGHYERFTGVPTSASCSVSAGRVYWDVLSAERRGELLGSTVQAVPHITGEILRRLDAAGLPDVNGQPCQVVIAEIGGTVGDIECQVFLEAVRQLRAERPGEVACVHLTLVPEVGPNREPKTKPSQHSVGELRRFGIEPDVLVARSSFPLDRTLLSKLQRTCGVGAVLSAPDVSSIYDVPANLAESGLDVSVAALLGLPQVGAPDSAWRRAVEPLVRPDASWPLVKVALAGKYSDGHDTYLSVFEALGHAAASLQLRVDITTVDATGIEDDPEGSLQGFDAVVVPGGFGTRGVLGKVAAAQFCRDSHVPYLGLCLGLQVAVVAHARSAGVADAVSAEWLSEGLSGTPVIALMDEQHEVTEVGGTMRLGSQTALLAKDSKVAVLYGKTLVEERHRHRYEVCPAVIAPVEGEGLLVSGRSQHGLVEFVERQDHPFFVATQAHPEFCSRPDNPHPLFVGLLAAALR